MPPIKKDRCRLPDAVNLRTNHKPVAYNDKSPIAAATRPHVPDQETAKTVTTNGPTATLDIPLPTTYKNTRHAARIESTLSYKYTLV